MARYKVLKSVAHSVGHSFTSLLNYDRDDYVMGHLLRTARGTNESTLTVDLLTGTAEPGVLLVPSVADSVSRYVRWFPELVASHLTNIRYVRTAKMIVAFDLSRRRPARYAPDCEESPFVCRVEIEDDRGKIWESEIRDWWFPEPGRTTRGRKSTVVRVVERLGQKIRSVFRRARHAAGEGRAPGIARCSQSLDLNSA
jgi:hypothetical protein